MKNTFGNNISLTVFGESHGEAIGAVLDGVAPGIEVDTEYIRSEITRRRGDEKLSTKRRESDEFEILSGVMNGRTEGTPIMILIKNRDTEDSSYEKLNGAARPGHADYTDFVKYHGFSDMRGGGHSSGRITAAITAAGAILKHALEKKNISIRTEISEFCGIDAKNTESSGKKFSRIVCEGKTPEEISALVEASVEAAREAKDSIGGILKTTVTGLEPGIGEPWFDSLEGMLAHGLFGIPAVKGVEFGRGFGFCDAPGSELKDELKIERTGGKDRIVTDSNNNGGINGGISNGNDIVFRTVIKPTPSVGIKQHTVNLRTEEETEIEITGRHDPAIFTRAGAVIDSVTALVICDMLVSRYGTDHLAR